MIAADAARQFVGDPEVLTRIAREEGYESDRARMGSKAAKQRWEARTGKLEAGRPLELIQIDHTPADVLVLTDDRLEVLGRPWVTVAIDVASRCVLGMYITMDAPSSVSVSLCIEHAVLPKPENNANPGIWPMYGKPKKILVDNGKAWLFDDSATCLSDGRLFDAFNDYV